MTMTMYEREEGNVRPEVEELTRFPAEAPEKMTIGQAAVWNNKLRALAPFSAIEERFVTEQFVIMTAAIAEREQVPPGILAYIVENVAMTLRVGSVLHE